MVTIKHLIAVSKWPGNWPGKVKLAKYRRTKLPNPDFITGSWPSNVVTEADWTTAVNDFDTKETAGKVTDRDIAWDTLKKADDTVKSMVQLKMDTDALNAKRISNDAGYDVKVTTIRLPQEDKAYDTEISGTILATASKTGYHWWRIKDKNGVITTLEPTKQAHTLIPALTVGDEYNVSNKKIGDGSDWTVWFPIVVK